MTQCFDVAVEVAEGNISHFFNYYTKNNIMCIY